MKAYRDEAPAREEDRRGIYVIAVVVAAIVIVTLLYFGMRDSAESTPDDSMQVVREVETVTPQPVDTVAVAPPVVQEAVPATGDFDQRQLGAPTTAVGAGTAPTAALDENGETLVIDGELLEQLEADAEAEAAAPTP